MATPLWNNPTKKSAWFHCLTITAKISALRSPQINILSLRLHIVFLVTLLSPHLVTLSDNWRVVLLFFLSFFVKFHSLKHASCNKSHICKLLLLKIRRNTCRRLKSINFRTSYFHSFSYSIVNTLINLSLLINTTESHLPLISLNLITSLS